MKLLHCVRFLASQSAGLCTDTERERERERGGGRGGREGRRFETTTLCEVFSIPICWVMH